MRFFNRRFATETLEVDGPCAAGEWGFAPRLVCWRDVGSRLAVLVLLSFWLTCGWATAEESLTAGRVDARADSVFRWDHEGAEAYLLEGRCELDSPDGLLACEQLLIIVEPLGKSLDERRWRIRAAATGRLTPPLEGGVPIRRGQSTWVANWTMFERPTIDAPLFRGPPRGRPPLLDALQPQPTNVATRPTNVATRPTNRPSPGGVVQALAVAPTDGPRQGPDYGSVRLAQAELPIPAGPVPAGPNNAAGPNNLSSPNAAPSLAPPLNAPGNAAATASSATGPIPEAIPVPEERSPSDRIPPDRAPSNGRPSVTDPLGLIENDPGGSTDERVRALQPPSNLPLSGSVGPPLSSAGSGPPAGSRIVGPDEPLMPATPPQNDAKFQLLLGGGSQAVEIYSRGKAIPAQIETQNRPETNETVVIARGGVTIQVRDVMAQMPTGSTMDLGTVTLSADRVVAWLPLVTGFISGQTSMDQAEGEFFLEGNIVFRQGDRVIYANSMYYNVARQYGMVMEAEAITPGLDFDGVVRLKADVLQQVSRGEFIAFDAAVTTSRMGVPRYWLQSEQLRMTDQTRPGIDPVTGAPVQIADRLVTSNNNFVYLGGVPVLYWPRFSSDMTMSSFYVTGVKVKNDSIFGTQGYVDWDMFQLIGKRQPPQGVEWLLSTDYLSQRGPALGTTVTYRRNDFFGIPGPTYGFFDAWGIRDTGLDVLGRGRRDIPPESEYRGRVLGRHRQWLNPDLEWIAEVGYLSDRNFLEQYFEEEWDQDKDHDTTLRIRKYLGNQLFELSADVRAYDFYSETERLPRLEHYLLGGSLLADRLTWSMKNEVGYANLNIPPLPEDPAQAAITDTPLPGEANAEGIIAATRHEVSMPLELGPLKFAPYLGGEASHYGEDMTGESLTRLIGQGGIRGALPMWRVDPTVQSSLLNVRGLSHRVEFVGDLFYADSDTPFEDLPYYDQLDDNAQEEYRRRFVYNSFGGPPLPPKYDPRTYALRHGMQRYVTNPGQVVADDMAQARFGIHQRWQTKRGATGRERIVDLLRFDVDTIVFADSERDNFGEALGPTTYDFRYHVGDRVSLVSDGYFDFFDDGLRSISVGVRSGRPGLGEAYVGFLSLDGPTNNQVLRTNYDYRLNEKWIVSAMNTYDFGPTGNVGQAVGLTRIGESFLVRFGLDIDSGRDNVGFSFMIEPRFLATGRLGRLGGQWIPPVGMEGLE